MSDKPTVEMRCPKCMNITERDGNALHVPLVLDRRDAQIATLKAKLARVREIALRLCADAIDRDGHTEELAIEILREVGR
jgi:hypothetical protein